MPNPELDVEPELGFELCLATKDSQSTHWITVGLDSCVPIFTLEREQ